MRLSRSLGLAAAAAAGLSLSSGAFAGIATPNSQPIPTLLPGFPGSAFGAGVAYSAQSIALSAGGNTVVLPNATFPGGFPGYLSYVAVIAPFPATLPIATGQTVVWSAPAADTFTIADPGFPAAGTACIWSNAGGPAAGSTPAAAGNKITCTAPVPGAPYSSVSLATFGAFTGNKVSLSGPDIAQLGTNTFAGLAPLSFTTSAQSAVVQINAAGPGDPAGGIPSLAVDSKNSFSVTLVPNTLLIDLSGSGAPAIAPGAGFLQPLANGTRPVSTAGYLGALWVNTSQFDLDARTGLTGIGGPGETGLAGNPGGTTATSQTAITGTVSTTLTGDFATLTAAYLVPNNNGVPNENAANCTPTAPANSIAGAIDTAKRAITFATFNTAQNTTAASSQPVYGVCLVTNGTQVIQESPTAGGLIPTPAPNTIQIVVSAAVTGVTNPYFLTPAPSTAFGSIQYQGSIFFAQNVFGAQNLYPTFFRAVNSSNAPVKVWAVLTKDVNNVVPETGNGSCGDTTAGPNGTTATCNTAFIANLTALTDPTGLSKGLIQANTAVYYTADQIAALAGTTLPASSLHATVYLMSPSSGVRFSAVSQNPVNLDLISVP